MKKMITSIFCIKRKDVLLFIVISLLTLQSQAFSQTGTIKGKVYDKTNNEKLVGTAVVVRGTTLGAAADLNGNYIIPNVPEGKNTLTASYIGYISDTISLSVTAGKTIEYDFYLEPKAIQGQTVEVTAQAKGQLQAIQQQLTSNTIINVVSAEKIHQLPDADAATALSRLPGLSLMNGDQVVIRGIQAKMDLVQVNGIQLPSTDINTRATDLGFISSNMLSGIEVVKVITPDMDANTIGGIVNLRLREAPANFHFDVLSQGNFNQQDRTIDNYRFWASASDRFLDDQLGIFVQANADRTDDGNDQTSASYTFNQEFGYGQSTYYMNAFNFNDQQNIVSNAGGSIIMDYKLPHGKLTLQNTLSNVIYNMTTYNNQFDFNLNRILYTLNRDKNHKVLLVNALQGEYNFGDIKADFTLSHSFSDKSTDIRYGDPGDNVEFQNSLDSHPFGVDTSGNPIIFNTQKLTFTPDDVYKIKVNPNDYKNAPIADWAILRSQAFNEHIYNSKLDFTVPIAFTNDFSSEFKVGGKFSRTTRSNDLNEWYHRTGDADFYTAVSNFIPGKILSNTNPILFTDLQNTDYTRGQYFLNDTYPFNYAFNTDKTDNFFVDSRADWANPVHKANSVRYDFNGAEIFSAAYLMGSFNIGPRLSLIAGTRFEHYNMDYHATFFYVTHSVDGNGKLFDTLNSVNRNDDHLFPNAQIRYKFTDWCDLRLAYTQSVSRPDYNFILPNVYFSPGEGGQAGNTKLKPALSDNFDGYLSFYNNDIGLLTLGGFYKNIKDVFFQTIIYYQNLKYYNVSFPDSATWRALGTQAPGPADQITTYINNPHPAHIRGFELEWQTHFWYLPNPFNSLVLDINYTRVWSDMDYLQLFNNPVAYQYTDEHGRVRTGYHYVTIDTVRNARLLNQGDNIFNITLGVDYKGFSGRFSFNLQGNVITSVGSRPEADQFTGNIYKWDFTIKQELPIKGFSVSLSGVNIFHNPVYTYQNFRRVPGGPIFNNLVTTTYSPRTFELNVRYTL
jgi:TonB-dependent receptor